jgi:hypothetical protein
MLRILLKIAAASVILLVTFVVLMLLPVVPCETGAVLQSGINLKFTLLPLIGYLLSFVSAGAAIRSLWSTPLVILGLLAAFAAVNFFLTRWTFRLIDRIASKNKTYV